MIGVDQLQPIPREHAAARMAVPAAYAARRELIPLFTDILESGIFRVGDAVIAILDAHGAGSICITVSGTVEVDALLNRCPSTWQHGMFVPLYDQQGKLRIESITVDGTFEHIFSVWSTTGLFTRDLASPHARLLMRHLCSAVAAEVRQLELDFTFEFRRQMREWMSTRLSELCLTMGVLFEEDGTPKFKEEVR